MLKSKKLFNRPVTLPHQKP